MSKPITARQWERQAAWAARRAQTLAARRTSQPARSAAPTPAKAILALNHDHTPLPADLDALLAEVDAETRDNIVRLLNTDRPCFYVPDLPKQYLGRAVVALYLRGAASAVVREAVEWAWGLGTPYVIEAAGARLFEMLRYCDFPLPPSSSDTVTVWRGTRGVTLEEAQRGLCWTTDRDAACAFLRVLELKWGVTGVPLVIKREVPRSAIVLHTTLGDLDEVVIDAEPGGSIDGKRDEWRAAGMRWARDMHAAGSMAWDDPNSAAAWLLTGHSSNLLAALL